MVLIPNSFRVDTTVCYPDKDDAASFFCLPEVVTPERDALHRPTVTLLLAGGQSLLQMGVHWELDRDTLGALTRAIAARFPTLSSAAIRLSMPAVTVSAVELLLGDGSGSVNVLTSSASSGFPPYTAIFSQTLSPAQQPSVIAALTNRPGFLQVRYPISLPVETIATTTLSGDVAPEIAHLQTATFIIDPTPMLLQQAIAAGRLVLTRTRIGNPIDATVKAADAQAMQRAATLLRQMAGPRQDGPHAPGAVPVAPAPVSQQRTATLTTSATASATVATLWDVVTDVSTWFTAGQGLTHIVTGPGGGGEPKKTDSAHSQEVTGSTTWPVRLAFDASETAINFIRARLGTESATLTGPDYAPVPLPLTDGEELQITVEYTDGGPPFTATVGMHRGGWDLTPADVGLTRVTVDTTDLFKTDTPATTVTTQTPVVPLTAARLHIRYQPGGTGTDDDRTLNFRARDADRIVLWYVVSRATDLAGTLTYDLKLTPATGPPLTLNTVVTRDPMIRLRPM